MVLLNLKSIRRKIESFLGRFFTIRGLRFSG
jgi:hypothetical protein